MPSRRTVLAGLGSLSAAAGGCVSGGPERAPPAVDPVQRLGTGTRLSFVADPIREYTYVPEEKQARYEREVDGVTRTGRMPFEEWGTRRAAARARARLWARFSDRYREYEFVTSSVGSVGSAELDAGGAGEAPAETAFERAVDVAPRLRYNVWYDDRTGEVVRRPPVSWEALVAAVPRTIEVTMAFPERAYRAVLPGVCQRVVSARPEDGP
ncbi:hypothetical protein [Natronomonas sp.]|uniref:hypothetical protein n=1 Tax=Natronomonas sp. TaxID=2184060 RepID=UPI0026157E62|nr:hypothetical protein [Natronomonas sp.]